MKEAVGESAMTIITISLVAGAVIAIGLIISTLLNNQSMRANCENSGGDFSGGECTYTNSSGNVVPCACEKNTCVCED